MPCLRAQSGFTVSAHRPLYERVPTHDEDGNMLGDFMMLLPGLRDRPQGQFAEVLARIESVINEFREVVFVDLNVPLNLLWVSVRAKPGIILDISTALKFRVPEALLIGQSTEY